jgi:hypothetical protein
VYNGETLLTPTQTLAGGGVYNVVNTLNNDVNTITLRLKKGAEEYVFEKNLGGKVKLHKAEEIGAKAFKNDNSYVTATLVDGNTVAQGLTGKLLKLDIEGTLKDSQRIQMHADAFTSLTENSKKVVFRIYCTDLGAEGLNFTFNVATMKNQYYSEVASAKLYNGMNVIEMSLASLNFAKNGGVKFGLFTFGNDATKSYPKTVYLQDVTVYNK